MKKLGTKTGQKRMLPVGGEDQGEGNRHRKAIKLNIWDEPVEEK